MNSILLLGPTGSGKSPLGNYLQTHGGNGLPCRHLDFGACLRAVASLELDAGLTPVQVQFVRRVLETGALLEDRQFDIARQILRTALAGHEKDLVILNGLPRHTGQARMLESILTVKAVIVLEAAAAVIAERLRLNTGGDRSGRTDDDRALVEKKLSVFAERTAPLIEHYRAKGAQVLILPVQIETTAESLASTPALLRVMQAARRG